MFCFGLNSQSTHLTGAGATLGFSGSIVSVIMVADVTLLMLELPNPPKPGDFFPARSASCLARCSSLALRFISARASPSLVFWSLRSRKIRRARGCLTHKFWAIGCFTKLKGIPYLSNRPENLLLMRVHLGKSTYLSQINVLSVAQGYDLIKCKYEIKTVLRDLRLLQHAAIFRDLKPDAGQSFIQDTSKQQTLHIKMNLYHSGEKPQSLQILQNIAVFSSDENHVEFF